MKGILLLLLMGVFLPPGLRAEEAFKEWETFSLFKAGDMEDVTDGEILTRMGSVGKTPEALSIQMCYLVEQPVAKTAALLLDWDGAKHPEMQIYASHSFKTLQPGEFDPFKFVSTWPGMEGFLEATKKEGGGGNVFALSVEEKKRLGEMSGPGRIEKPEEWTILAGEFWKETLRGRCETFEKQGLAGMPVSFVGPRQFQTLSQVEAMLAEEPRVARRFDGILRSTLLTPLPGPVVLPDRYYWDIFKADSIVACDLGVMYSRPFQNGFQIVECQIYVSNQYESALILYELRPILVGGRECTVIWRQDFITSPFFKSLTGLLGLVAEQVMMADVEKSAKLFQKDANKVK
ncbi:MAG: hypothetical protein SFY92_01060 [Verrucomicrobiae bacterium]|nr:hypothetical protein [Verrucomicrobiae bacterium]